MDNIPSKTRWSHSPINTKIGAGGDKLPIATMWEEMEGRGRRRGSDGLETRKTLQLSTGSHRKWENLIQGEISIISE